MSDHNDVVEKLSTQFKRKGFSAQTHGNNLPPGAGREGSIYRPDIIVRNTDGEIVWLVEVESGSGEGGKAMAGAALLADVCMERMNVRGKPKLLFVFHRPDSNLQLAEKRLLALKGRLTTVELVSPLSKNAALQTIASL